MRSPTVPTNPAGRDNDRNNDSVNSDGGEGYPSPPVLASLHDFSSIDVASAGPGKAVSLGSLSVPPSWPTPASKTEPISPSLSAAAGNAAPTDPEGRPRGRAFQQALMKVMTERPGITDATESEANTDAPESEK
jgi:hypothetical protein